MNRWSAGNYHSPCKVRLADARIACASRNAMPLTFDNRWHILDHSLLCNGVSRKTSSQVASICQGTAAFRLASYEAVAQAPKGTLRYVCHVCKYVIMHTPFSWPAFTCLYIYIYIHMYTLHTNTTHTLSLYCICICTYLYIYIYTYLYGVYVCSA